MASSDFNQTPLVQQAQKILKPFDLDVPEQIEPFERALWEATRKDHLLAQAEAPVVVLSVKPFAIAIPNSLSGMLGNYGNYMQKYHLEECIDNLCDRKPSITVNDELCQKRKQYFADVDQKIARGLEQQKMVQEQKDAGKCSIVPFPKAVAKRTISADATIAGLCLFAGPTFKGNCRIIERTITNHQSGEKTKLRIKVGSKTNKCGVLKQSHHRALHIAWQEWAQRGYKLAEVEGRHMGVLEMSMYKWTKILCGSTGGRDYAHAASLLEQMAAIRVEIAEANESGIVKSCGFSLISFSWSDQSSSKDGTWTAPGKNTRIRILMSEYITENFLMKKLRPMSLKTYLEIKDPGRKGITPLLFDWLEYQLSTREIYSKKLSKFPEDFGTTVYAKKSDRKKTIMPAINTLNGLLILEGRFSLKVWLEETSDGTDYKLMAQKILVVQ